MKNTCAWTQTECGYWITECDNAHEFAEGLPSDYKYRYCPFCGLPIKERPFSAEEESE